MPTSHWIRFVLSATLLGCSAASAQTVPTPDLPSPEGDRDSGVDDGGSLPAPDAQDASPPGKTPPDATPVAVDTGVASSCGEVFAPPVTADAYSDLDALNNKALVDALRSRVSGHKSFAYDSAKGLMFENPGFDLRGGKIECIYSGDLFDPDRLDKGGGYNVEHSWPRSEIQSEKGTAEGDMHHLFPTERDINSCRSSYEFGEADRSDKCARGGSMLGANKLFSVRMKYRGNIARAHFYFSVRYKQSIGAREEAALRCWHRQDPPDDEERARNEAIANLQKNRNPFIDRPELVERIADF